MSEMKQHEAANRDHREAVTAILAELPRNDRSMAVMLGSAFLAGLEAAGRKVEMPGKTA